MIYWMQGCEWCWPCIVDIHWLIVSHGYAQSVRTTISSICVQVMSWLLWLWPDEQWSSFSWFWRQVIWCMAQQWIITWSYVSMTELIACKVLDNEWSMHKWSWNSIKRTSMICVNHLACLPTSWMQQTERGSFCGLISLDLAVLELNMWKTIFSQVTFWIVQTVNELKLFDVES
jgi:hypothetical protein